MGVRKHIVASSPCEISYYGAAVICLTQKRIDLGKTNDKARIASNNKITLRFQTADFDGDFFKYTNDLFLVYHSGHFAKLTCAPK